MRQGKLHGRVKRRVLTYDARVGGEQKEGTEGPDTCLEERER